MELVLSALAKALGLPTNDGDSPAFGLNKMGGQKHLKDQQNLPGQEVS